MAQRWNLPTLHIPHEENGPEAMGLLLLPYDKVSSYYSCPLVFYCYGCLYVSCSDQLPRLGKRELIFLLSFTYNNLGTLGWGVACGALVRPGLGCAAPVWRPCRESRVGRVEGVRGAAAGWTCGGWGSAGGVGNVLGGLGWSSLETRRERSSLAFFYKIHSGAVSLDGDKYLIPAPNLRRTGASRVSQCTGYFAYSDALRGSFSPGTVPMWSGLPTLVVSSGPLGGGGFGLGFRLFVQRYVFWRASVQLLVSGFNGPSRMFFPFA